MNRILLKRIAGIGFASACSVALTALQSFFLAKLLSVEFFGITRTATAYMVALSMIGHFTLHNALASHVARSKTQEEISSYIYHATLLVIAVSGLVCITSISAIIFSGQWSSQLKIPLLIVIATLPLTCLTMTYNACLEALGNYRTYTFVILSTALVPLITLTPLSALWSLNGWLGGRIISSAILIAISFYALNGHFRWMAVNRTYIVELMAFARVQIFSGILSLVLMSADIILLERITHDLRAVANYGVALLLANACCLMPTVLARVYFKDISGNSISVNQKKREYIRITACLGIASSVFLFFLGPSLLSIFFGKDYVQAQSIIKVMAVGIIFNFLWHCISVINVAEGKPGNSVKVSATGALIGAVALFALIPLHQGAGAAWAMAIAYAGGTFVGLRLILSPGNCKMESVHAT